jgi:hypothetical protein
VTTPAFGDAVTAVFLRAQTTAFGVWRWSRRLNADEEEEMATTDPAGQPDIERPIDITDVPGTNDPGPVSTPDPHPDEDEMPLEDIDIPTPGQPHQQ